MTDEICFSRHETRSSSFIEISLIRESCSSISKSRRRFCEISLDLNAPSSVIPLPAPKTANIEERTGARWSRKTSRISRSRSVKFEKRNTNIRSICPVISVPRGVGSRLVSATSALRSVPAEAAFPARTHHPSRQRPTRSKQGRPVWNRSVPHDIVTC